jgi:hypothetical protein
LEPWHVIPLGEAPLALPQRALLDTTDPGEGEEDGAITVELLVGVEVANEVCEVEHFPNSGLHPF